MTGLSFPIDWRQEFAALRPYFEGKGGVVRIRYAGQQCAPNSFVRTLTSCYEGRWNGQTFVDTNNLWRSIRLDRANYKVRYLAEIRQEFEKKIRLRLPNPIGPDTSNRMPTVLSNNKAGRDQTITAEINYGESDAALGFRRDEWIKSLCEHIKSFLKNGHLMIIVMHGGAEEQHEFWGRLWEGTMSAPTADGLLLVRMIDDADKEADTHHKAAQPDLEISLPREPDAARLAHATEDVASWLASRLPGHSKDTVLGLARGFVLAHTSGFDQLHDNILFRLMRLVQQQITAKALS